MKTKIAIGIMSLSVFFLSGCSQTDRDKARAEAERAADKTKAEAQKLGQETKKAANSFSDQAKSASDSTTEAAAKLKQGAADASDAASKMGTQLGDAATTAKVKAQLSGKLGLTAVTDINVESSGHTVTLKGFVDSADAKRDAREVALRVEGVTKVDNLLKVRSKP